MPGRSDNSDTGQPLSANAGEALSSTIRCLYQFALDPTTWFENQAEWLALTDTHDPRSLDMEALLPHLLAIEALAESTPPAKAPEAGSIGVVLLDADGTLIQANAQASLVLAPLNVSLAAGGVPAWPGPEGAESIRPYLDELAAGRQTVVVPMRSLGKIVLGLLSPSATVRDRLGRNEGAARSRYTLLLPGESFNDESLGWLRARGLTETESNVAIRIGAGLSPQEVASELGSSINTVRTHVRAIFDKLGVNRQAELIKAISDLAVLGQWLDATDAPGQEDVVPSVAVSRLRHRLPDGRDLSYRCYGDSSGVPVVFFHNGWGFTLVTAEQQALLQSAGIALLAIDRPGFGESDRLQPYSVEQVARDVLNLLKEQRIERCVLMSAAAGVRFALQTAVLAPTVGVEVTGVLATDPRKGESRVDAPEPKNAFVKHYQRLARNPALVATFARLISAPSRRFVWRRMMRMGHGPGFDELDPSSRERIYRHTVSSVEDATHRSTAGLSDEISTLVRDTEIAIDDLTCPVQFWRGEADHVLKLDDLKRYLGTTAKGNLHHVSGASTLIHFSHFPAVLDAVLALAGVRPNSDSQTA